MKTIELRGGPGDGNRITVPSDRTEASFPDSAGDGFVVYCPSAGRTQDGVELWELTWENAVGDAD